MFLSESLSGVREQMGRRVDPSAAAAAALPCATASGHSGHYCPILHCVQFFCSFSFFSTKNTKRLSKVSGASTRTHTEAGQTQEQESILIHLVMFMQIYGPKYRLD